MKPYRPSNGTEGLDFEHRQCKPCFWYRGDDGCPILNAAMAWAVGDHEYPSQWVIDDDKISNPRCLAFRPQEFPRQGGE